MGPIRNADGEEALREGDIEVVKIWVIAGLGSALLQGLLRLKRHIVMAEGNLEGIDEKYKSRKEYGRYVIPWGGNRPSLGSALWWKLSDKNNSGVGGSWWNGSSKDKELEENLPVVSPDLEALKTPKANWGLRVTWIGHATMLVQMDGINILTDPVFNDYCGYSRMAGYKRFRPVPCTIADLPDIDAVIISHNHYDHLDVTSVKELNEKFGERTCWLVPMGTGDWMKETGCKNVVELDWWEHDSELLSNHKGKNIKFVFTPSQHWCRRGVFDENCALWGSWSIIGPKHRFFFGGDTGYCDVFKVIGQKYGPFDLAAIPIGAYSPRWFMKFQHVDPQDAVVMHKDLNAKNSVAIHWGTFALAHEHYMEPAKELRETLEKKKIPDSEFFILKHGETKILTS